MSDLYVRQGTEKLKHYVGHLRTGTDTSTLMKISKEYVELVSGRGKCPLQHPEVNIDSWTQTSWIQSLGVFLSEAGGSVKTAGERVIPTQRDNDCQLMDKVDEYSKTGQDYI